MTTAGQIAKLEDALAKGVLTVESDGERITYKSTADQLAALDYLKRKLAEETAPVAGARPATTIGIYTGY